MNLDDDFHDLAPLDPGRDPERFERMVGAIARAAAPELARRRAAALDPAPLLLPARWIRPTLSAAAALAAAAAAVLMLADPQPPARPGIAEALGYPDPVAAWVEADRTPSVEELIVALEGDTP